MLKPAATARLEEIVFSEKSLMPLENTDEDEKKLDKAEIALSEAKNVPTLDDR